MLGLARCTDFNLLHPEENVPNSVGTQKMGFDQETEDLRALLVDIESTLDKSQFEDQFPKFEQLEQLSQHEREVWLAERCSQYDNAVRQFYNDRDHFTIDLHKKLRKVTRRWASWNHKKFGPVISREQVQELLLWEQNNHPRLLQGVKDGNSSGSEQNESNPLEQFETYCKNSEHLLQTFLQNIYRPLCDFFSNDSDSESGMQDVPRKLESIVQKWEALLNFSPVNEKLFSKHSEKSLHDVLSRGAQGSYEFDNVLRLVPDLLEKKSEALRLAQKWRNIMKPKEERRGTFVLEAGSKILAKRGSIESPKLQRSDERLSMNPNYDAELTNLSPSLVHGQSCQCKQTDKEVYMHRSLCCENQTDVESSKDSHHLLQRARVQTCDSPVSEKSSQQKSWQQELDSAKMRYCTQKIKFLNARKQIMNLNSQLDTSQQKCEKLTQNFDAVSNKNKHLESQLDSAKKHIQSQMNMVEALQHQCYTLKHELDKSNIKKTKLHENLEKSMRRCKTLEDDLLHTRNRCSMLESCVPEKQLSMLNDQERIRKKKALAPLKNSSKGSNSPLVGKKDCLFPDINAARSF